MVQITIIGLLFGAAAFYLGRMVYRSFQTKGNCASGCAKCAVSDSKK
jgi:hypothetical protein